MADENGLVDGPSDEDGGLYVVGDFLSLLPGREWTDGGGNKRQPYHVKILAGEVVYTIEFRSMADVPAELGAAQRMDRVTVPVVARIAGPSEGRDSFRVQFNAARS